LSTDTTDFGGDDGAGYIGKYAWLQ